MLRFGLVVGTLVGLVGCAAGGVPPVTAAFVQKAQQRSPAVTEQGLMAGREAFTSRCASCHELPLPSAHAAEEWPGLVKRMAGMAKLDATQEQQVLDYVLAAREP